MPWDREIAASAEMVLASAAFTLGAVAYLSIEGWLGTTFFLLAAIAAVALFWVARWEADGLASGTWTRAGASKRD